MTFIMVRPLFVQYQINETFEGYTTYSIDNFHGSTVQRVYEVLEKEDDVFYVFAP